MQWFTNRHVFERTPLVKQDAATVEEGRAPPAEEPGGDLLQSLSSSGLLPSVCLSVIYTIIGIVCIVFAVFAIGTIYTLVVTARVLETDCSAVWAFTLTAVALLIVEPILRHIYLCAMSIVEAIAGVTGGLVDAFFGGVATGEKFATGMMRAAAIETSRRTLILFVCASLVHVGLTIWGLFISTNLRCVPLHKQHWSLPV